MLIELLNINDAQGLYHLIENNRERLENYFPISTKEITSLQSTVDYINNQKLLTAKKEFYFFSIKDEHQQIVGALIIKSFDWRIPKAEIGYYLDKNFEGKGIMTKAVKWLIDYGFNELNILKLYARIDPENIGSKIVALKNGFELEGLLKSEYRVAGKRLVDIEYYGLVNKSYSD
jgi:RimJ/RimL family protein N-acetyltransferase